MTAPKKLSFSHVGFYVKDLAKMRAFYSRILGLVATDEGVARGHKLVFMSREVHEHHQIVLVEGRTGSLDEKVINQISLRAEKLDDLRGLWDAVKREPDVTDINPTDHGNAWSLYFRDPEKNRVEVFVDSPWYVEQPRVEPLDLTKSDEDIIAATRASVEKHPTYRPYGDWRQEFAKKLDRTPA